MKKILYVLFAMFALTVNAHAEDQVPLDFKVISVEDGWYGDKGVKIDVKDIKKGVFIMAGGSFKTVYPKTAELLKDIFKSKGIKVVDKIEDADVGFLFFAGNKFGSFEGVENDLGAAPPGESSALAFVSKVAFYKATNGGMLAIMGNEFDAKKNGVGDVMITVARNPKLNWRGMVTGDDSKTVASVITSHINRMPEKGEHFAAVLLTADVTQFVDQHFVGLPTQAAAAPGVAPAAPVAGASAPVASK